MGSDYMSNFQVREGLVGMGEEKEKYFLVSVVLFLLLPAVWLSRRDRSNNSSFPALYSRRTKVKSLAELEH